MLYAPGLFVWSCLENINYPSMAVNRLMLQYYCRVKANSMRIIRDPRESEWV